MKTLNLKFCLVTTVMALSMGVATTSHAKDKDKTGGAFFNAECHQVCQYVKDNADEIDKKIAEAGGAAAALAATGAVESLGVDEAAVGVAAGLASTGNSIAEGFSLLHCLKKAKDMHAAGCARS